MEKIITGRITGNSGGLYVVDTPEGELRCRARGAFRHNHEKPLVGDRVEISEEEQGKEGGRVISRICERRNSLIRPPIANIDYMFVTAASASPEPDGFMIDKLTAIAEYNKIKPVIVIGKHELDPTRSAELSTVYRLAGYDVFEISCKTGEGVGELKKYIEDNIADSIAAFAGQSGVGKSSFLNLLYPGLGLETSAVSAKTERGRHTTRSVTLYRFGGGYIADTPGFSMLDFETFDFFSKEDLPDTFLEFADYFGRCRYTKCTHTKEDGCAILEAVREGKIAKERHESYLALYDILKNKHKWD